ncbi:uclacyanin 1-like [Chenopodium quinoa]|uniref:uclacyanin 1-like n=1 Tax=Chenopodium quinoa TaxID=63459 RepID=UPI000B780E33|nr:uclacyanin 1-like [Chenopodium quinoa]
MKVFNFSGFCCTLFFFFTIFFLALQTSNCATVVVDGVTHWNHPSANIGDTIIFKHKNQYNLYIFRTKEAFNTCNFTQATPLSNHNSTTYTWHPSRTGSFYFAFNNGTKIPCQQGQKLAINITTTAEATPTSPAPELPPPATPGGVVSSSPSYPWPFQPREKEGASPGPSYNDIGISPVPAASPAAMGSIPFINSNPAVPLPTGEVDSATIRPFPTSANQTSSQGVKVMGFFKGVIPLCYVIIVMVTII